MFFFYDVFIVKSVTEELCLLNIVNNWQRTFLGLYSCISLIIASFKAKDAELQ